MTIPFDTLLYFLLFLAPINCQNAEWIYPPIAGPRDDCSKNIALQIGSTQTLKWQSSLPTVSFSWVHEHPSGEDTSAVDNQVVVVNEFFYREPCADTILRTEITHC
jgi:hypothetical protein